MPASAPLLDRQFLEKLERLTIQWQKSFPGLVGGHNISRFSGSGQEFLDHRQFHHGDDLRAVNWRAYLRLEKLFLKMFQVEPSIPVRILLDCSNSMTTTRTAIGVAFQSSSLIPSGGEGFAMLGSLPITKPQLPQSLAPPLCGYLQLASLKPYCVPPRLESLPTPPHQHPHY